MLTLDMVDLLCCPRCRDGRLGIDIREQSGQAINEGELACENCSERYPVHLGIPDLIPHSLLTSEQWKLWRDHLRRFEERRNIRRGSSSETTKTPIKRSSRMAAFARFTGIDQGAVLDVGCGPGKFRHHLDESRVRYIGLDPVTLPHVETFPYVRALAEYIPFQDKSFSHIVVLAAMDHFENIEGFLREAIRVLQPGGRLHLLQSVHEVRGPLSLVKAAAHAAKDLWEDRINPVNSHAPKHLTEFKRSTLRKVLATHYDILAEDDYSPRWYHPNALFITMRPKESLRQAVA